MLALNTWLLIAAISVLSIQGVKLAQVQRVNSVLIFAISALAIMLFAYLCSGFIASQHIATWHSVAAEQLQFIQIIVLLELALAVFSKYKLMLISCIFSLAYGQLLMFQQGWFDLPFHWLGLLYASAVICLMLISVMLAKLETYWPHILFSMLLGCSIFSGALSSQAAFAATNWLEMSVSLVVIAGVVIIGIILEKAKVFKRMRKTI